MHAYYSVYIDGRIAADDIPVGSPARPAHHGYAWVKSYMEVLRGSRKVIQLRYWSPALGSQIVSTNVA